MLICAKKTRFEPSCNLETSKIFSRWAFQESKLALSASGMYFFGQSPCRRSYLSTGYFWRKTSVGGGFLFSLISSFSSRWLLCFNKKQACPHVVIQGGCTFRNKPLQLSTFQHSRIATDRGSCTLSIKEWNPGMRLCRWGWLHWAVWQKVSRLQSGHW